MKKITICILLLLAYLPGKSQVVPNAGFESWSNFLFMFDEPKDYFTSNYLPFLMGSTTPRPNVFKSADSHSGSYAMKMESYANPSDSTRGIPGLAITGSIKIGSELSYSIGFPYTGRPAEFRGYYRYSSGEEVDTGSVLIFLFRHAAGEDIEPVGLALVTPTEKSSYSYFAEPFIYISDASPDSAVVVASTSYRFDYMDILESMDLSNIDVPIGTTLYLDDLSLSSTTGVETSIDELLSQVKSYPNPASGQMTISFYAERPAPAVLNVYNMMGQLLERVELEMQAGKNNVDCSTAALAAGTYSYQLVSGGQVSTRKFSVIR